MPTLSNACSSWALKLNAMNSRARKILFYSFVAMFFILSAVILPYAFGYKLNFSGMKLQRTGMFDIKTTPAGANIYLNGKKQVSFLSQLSGRESAATTPIKLKNITPGTYQVRLELDGYWPWEKQLIINPSETTYLEDVYFFKKSQPLLLDQMPIENIQTTLVSPDHKHLAVLTKQELKIFTLDKNQAPQTITLPQPIKNYLSWSPSGQFIIAGQSLVDWRNSNITDLKNSGLKSFDKLLWADDSLVYIREKNNLKSLNLKNNQLAVIDLGPDTTDFTLKDGYLYLLRDGSMPSLSIFKLNGNLDKEVELIKLKAFENYRFIDLGQNTINLQEITSKKLYLVSTKLPWLKDYSIKEIGALTVGQWVSGDKLVFGNNFELSLWTSDANQAKLLTRISHPITALAWHKSNNYVVFATDRSINTLELDDRYAYNISTLLDLDKIAYPSFNRDGNRIIFFATINNQSGFYLLEI